MAQPNRLHTTHMWNIPYRPQQQQQQQQQQQEPAQAQTQAPADTRPASPKLARQEQSQDSEEEVEQVADDNTQDSSLDTEDEHRPRNHIEIPKITPMNSAPPSEALGPAADGSASSSHATLPSASPSTPPSTQPPPHEQKETGGDAPKPKRTPVDPAALARGLEGRFVDEFGNILDWDGTVMGRVEGDLPSMVGRAISTNGEVIDADGEVAGHVSENYAMEPAPAKLPVQNGLVQDEEGNIYNEQGEIVGKMKKKPADAKNVNAAGCSGFDEPGSGQDPAAPSPSEIYLDVKSTHDGIQLIIKIPTVFNRDP